MNKIAIIMGSQSDWETMKFAANILDEFEQNYDTLIISAHRTPERLYSFAKDAEKNYSITLRPSGTEPKIKFYFSLSGDNSEDNKNIIEDDGLTDKLMKIDAMLDANI